jgi:hypothetical protein
MTEKRNAPETEPAEKPTQDDEAIRENGTRRVLEGYISDLRAIINRLRKRLNWASSRKGCRELVRFPISSDSFVDLVAVLSVFFR